MLKFHREHVAKAAELNEFMLAQLTAWVVNTGFRSTENPVSAKDFMPSEWKKTARERRKPKTPEQASAAFTANMRGLVSGMRKKMQNA